MYKSKHIFLILACVYIGIAIGGLRSIVTISSNVLFGLSLSTLLIAMSDAINKFCGIKILKNEYNYSISIASAFLQRKIDAGIVTSGNFDVCNIKANVDELKDTPKTDTMHPNEFRKKTGFKIIKFISMGLFVVGIASFLVTPFSKANESDTFSTYITIFAFAIMCISIFCDDIKDALQRDMKLFEWDKVCLIAALFPDFMFEYNSRKEHLTSYTEMERQMQEAANNTQQIMNGGDNGGND